MKRVAFWLAIAFCLSPVLGAQQSLPRGKAEGVLRGKKVTIDYGQAELKGRTLEALIEKIPADRVWRTGVDDITTLTNAGPLLVGGKNVPAGTYSVYVFAPAAGNWALILNSDPGIELGALGKRFGFEPPPADAKRLWPHLEGYAADPAKNVPGIANKEIARATMKPGVANPPADPFRISLTPEGASLSMTLAWGEKTWSVDLTTGK